MSDVAYPRVQAHLSRLKLPRMAECLDTLAQEAAKHDWTYIEFLDQCWTPKSRPATNAT
jgi:DNA replication protein DnaC